MKLDINMLIEDLESTGSPKDVFRVLCFHPNGKEVALINIWDRLAEVKWKAISELAASWDLGQLSDIDDPFESLIQRNDEDLSEKQIARRNENYELIKPIIKHGRGMSIYNNLIRSKLIAEISKSANVHRETLYILVRRYLQRGQTMNALIPDYDKTGNKGKEKAIKSGKKRGRPRKVSLFGEPKEGINITAQIKNKILRGMDKYFVKKGMEFTLAYNEMIKEFFNGGYTLEKPPRPIPLPNEELPTIAQVRYWFYKERDPEFIQKGRLKRKYALQARPLDGDIYMVADAPGHWQLDGIRLPFHLVDPFDRAKIIGPALGVFILDTWSSYIVGLDSSLNNESWTTIGYAILVAVMDKVAFCADYGIEISQEDWNISGVLPHTILADKGPVAGYNAGSFGRTTEVEIVNNPAYRPDLKSPIERNFLQFWREHALTMDIPATIKDRIRGDPDYIPEASLTHYELMQILILYVVWRNSGGWEMPAKIIDRDMANDGVRRFPASVLEWGLHNKSGLLKKVSPQKIKLEILRTGYATIDRFGIYFRGFHYRNKVVESRKWSVRKKHKQASKNMRVVVKGRKRSKIKISYDERLVDKIYARLDDGLQVFECILSPRREDQRFKGCSWAEVEERRRVEREESRANRVQVLEKTYERDAIARSIVENAVSQRKAATEGMSDQERKKDRTQNRQAAKAAEAARRLKGLGLQPPVDAEKAGNTPQGKEIQAPSTRTQPDGYVAEPKNLEKIRKAKEKKKSKPDESEE